MKSGISTFQTIMTEKLCLQWNDYKENVNSAFGRLRSDKELIDVTLACEDGKQIEAHKVVLPSSSPLFGEILQRSKNLHPYLIFVIFLHWQNFWRIKFTPKNANFSR